MYWNDYDPRFYGGGCARGRFAGAPYAAERYARRRGRYCYDRGYNDGFVTGYADRYGGCGGGSGYYSGGCGCGGWLR